MDQYKFDNISMKEFLIMDDYLTNPEQFTNIKDPHFWKRFKHGLYLSQPDKNGNRFYYLPVSYYMYPYQIEHKDYLFDDSDDDPDETIIPLITPHEDDQFQHGALFYQNIVYLKIDSSNPASKTINFINQDQQRFILKSSQYEKYKLKPLHYANPNVYFGEYFFRDKDLFFLMHFSGKNLYDFLNINPHLPSNMLNTIIQKIIDLVSTMHEKSIIHTDLKLENICIKINDDGQPNLNLIDFDDAIMPAFNPILPTILPGTFTFYAPEIFKCLPKAINHFSSFIAFQQLAFYIIDKTVTSEHEQAFEKASKENCSLCIFPENTEESTINNLYQLSPYEFMQLFIQDNFKEIFGIETDLFALGCIIHLILNFHPAPEQSPFYHTMTILLSHDPQKRHFF